MKTETAVSANKCQNPGFCVRAASQLLAYIHK
jgi:hypothetical protein